ncbi:hypothetical protein CDAR_367331 [Caerostris darwini]|uniref:Uncharacterized protein n=1 Tax=Caerostris darwini TaxID=1538125 RepID=A0AAV4WFR1_9ARAC|nr:hypothetical protein CDAR_367331 [Caerostris darwini]
MLSPNPISGPLADDFLKLFLHPFFFGGTITVTCNSNTLSPSYGFFPTPGCFKRTANDNAGASSGVDNVPKLDQEKTESPLIKKKVIFVSPHPLSSGKLVR